MAKFMGVTCGLVLVLLAVATTAQPLKERVEFRRYIVVPSLSPSSLKGVFEIYSLNPDGSFTFGQDNESAPRERGTYQIRGDEVIFRMGSREVVGQRSRDGRSIVIQGNTYERSP